MRSFVVGMCITLAIAGGLYSSPRTAPVADSIDKGAKWLVSVQGADGGWGQGGGETSYIRATEHLESNGNDVANTAVAALALLQAGRQAVSAECGPRDRFHSRQG